MSSKLPQAPALSALYRRWLTSFFLMLELVTVGMVFGFVLMPMAERSADDLAGLLILSAQTWAELPPQTRTALEAELRQSHDIALRPAMPAVADSGLRHGFYVRQLEASLERRLGREGALLQREVADDGSDWLWLSVPTGSGRVGVGFAVRRLETRPVAALSAALALSAVLIALLAWWLARRTAGPVAQLEAAAGQLARGERPALLPEEGPRELADLARHFNQMATQVHEMADARTTVYAGLSHDLRTPLARMRLALELLRLRPEPALVDRLDADIEEMSRFINQMLEMAKGIHTGIHQDIHLSTWLAARVDTHRHALAPHSALQLHCSDDLWVGADETMLARVLDNLLNNAQRYAPGVIEVLALLIDGPDASVPIVKVGVLDRGPGMPKDQLTQAFRPFQSPQAPHPTSSNSFGLGLAIVKQLCKAQGWTVQLANRDGGGLAVWLHLPAVAAPPHTASGMPRGSSPRACKT